MAESVVVYKLNHAGVEQLHWTGEVLERTPSYVRLRAAWTRGEHPLGYVTFAPGDVFVEHYWADRWYNVFEIFGQGLDGADGAFKGWYCNVARPAEFAPGVVRTVDLALDLWVWPDRRTLVLDEEEFAALDLVEEERAAAQAALGQLLALADTGRLPAAGA
jgi:hypothetical protein